MSELDKDLEEQIDKLVFDFRNKITKIVTKHSNKILKEQAKSFKEELKLSSSPKRPVPPPVLTKNRRPRDYDSDSD